MHAESKMSTVRYEDSVSHYREILRLAGHFGNHRTRSPLSSVFGNDGGCMTSGMQQW
jgi:hypothetical protein